MLRVRCELRHVSTPACRSLSAQLPLLHEACSRTGMVAQLFRLFGLAMTFNTRFMATAVLRAAGSLCDFGSERRAECLAAMTGIAAGPDAPVIQTVWELLRTDCIEASTGMHDAVAALDVALTLLEAAAQCEPFPLRQGEEAASLFARAEDVGPHVIGGAWLPRGASNVMYVARAVVLTDLQHGAAYLRLDPQLPANLRRMAVASATFA